MAMADRTGRKLPWARREKWCKQIVEGVAALHDKEVVAGYLGESPRAGVGIDRNDDAVLYGRFRQTWTYDETIAGVVPPEYRPFTSGKSSGIFEALPTTDIYQLGLLLWRIANHTVSGPRSAYCHAAGCSATDQGICNESHADPVQLPNIVDDVPAYLSNIINACRAEDPVQRPSALDLLETYFPATEKTVSESEITVQLQGYHAASPSRTDLYPSKSAPSSSSLETTHEPRGLFLTRPEDAREKFGAMVICNSCDTLCIDAQYHCSECLGGDYDLCTGCIEKGFHCLDTSHYLRRYTDHGIDSRRLGSVNEDGTRDILDD